MLALARLGISNAKAAAVLRDELEPGGFECRQDRLVIHSRHAPARIAVFESLNCWFGHSRLLCEIGLSPLHKGAGGAAKVRCHQNGQAGNPFDKIQSKKLTYGSSFFQWIIHNPIDRT